jgi:hypothetical protein
MNRYYSSQWGRFLSPDRYGGSARLRNPQSWNRYVYVMGDPLNHRDRKGLDLFDWGDIDGSGVVDGSLWGFDDDTAEGGCGPMFDWCATGTGVGDEDGGSSEPDDPLYRLALVRTIHSTHSDPALHRPQRQQATVRRNMQAFSIL